MKPLNKTPDHKGVCFLLQDLYVNDSDLHGKESEICLFNGEASQNFQEPDLGGYVGLIASQMKQVRTEKV